VGENEGKQKNTHSDIERGEKKGTSSIAHTRIYAAQKLKERTNGKNTW